MAVYLNQASNQFNLADLANIFLEKRDLPFENEKLKLKIWIDLLIGKETISRT